MKNIAKVIKATKAKNIFLTISILFIFAISTNILAKDISSKTTKTTKNQITTFIKSYTYIAGDDDSKNGARAIALRELKNELLGEIGVYVKSEINLEKSSGLKNKFSTHTNQITAGITKIAILDEQWDGVKFYVKVAISLNEEDVAKQIEAILNNKQLLKDLKQSEQKANKALEQNKKLRVQQEQLKKELKLAKKQNKTNKINNIQNEQNQISKTYKQGTNTIKASEYFDIALKYQKSKDYINAIKYYIKAIELDNTSLGAYYNRGLAYYNIRGYKKAIKDFTKAIELDSSKKTKTNAYNNRGLAYKNMSEYKRAIKDYNKAIELDNTDARTYYNRGNVYDDMSDYKKAIKDFTKAIELDSSKKTKANAYNNRGLAYKNMSDFKNACYDSNIAKNLGNSGLWDVLQETSKCN